MTARWAAVVDRLAQEVGAIYGTDPIAAALQAAYDAGLEEGAAKHVEHNRCLRCYEAGHAAGVAQERAEAKEIIDVFRGCGDHVYPREDCAKCFQNSAVCAAILAALRARETA